MSHVRRVEMREVDHIGPMKLDFIPQPLYGTNTNYMRNLKVEGNTTGFPNSRPKAARNS
jgi:hypothetical protein